MNDVKKLTYDELLINTLLFLTAGYETTSASFAYATYILATHTDVQKKLQDELDWDTNCMDLFWKEVLRMYPIATPFIDRCCVQNTQVFNYKIKKDIVFFLIEFVNRLHLISSGSVIQADVYSIHFDPLIWGPVDPHEFHPERHLTKRHPCAFLTGGPEKKSHFLFSTFLRTVSTFSPNFFTKRCAVKFSTRIYMNVSFQMSMCNIEQKNILKL